MDNEWIMCKGKNIKKIVKNDVEYYIK